MRNKKKEKSKARKEIERLIALAGENEKYAKRYVRLARKIAERTRTRIPKELRRKFCKHCNSYFIHGKNVRVRRNEKGIVYSCLSCEKITRFPVR